VIWREIRPGLVLWLSFAPIPVFPFHEDSLAKVYLRSSHAVLVGAFGGGGIVTACCSRIIVSDHARIGVSGPEVIETNKGIEEFDAKDKGLVWRVDGGRTRSLMGGADRFVLDRIKDFRAVAHESIAGAPSFSLETLSAEQARLEARLTNYGTFRDAPPIWQKAGIEQSQRIAEMTEKEFASLPRPKEATHDAR
jgi:malonate decarboxylase beta subunit